MDCGSGLKCEPAERSYSCKGKVEVCLKFENYTISFEFLDWFRPSRQKNVSPEESLQDFQSKSLILSNNLCRVLRHVSNAIVHCAFQI